MEDDIISISIGYVSGSGNDCWVNCLNEIHQKQWTHPHKHCSSAGSLQDKWPATRIQMNPQCSCNVRRADSCGCWSHIRSHLQKKNKGDCVWKRLGGGRGRHADDVWLWGRSETEPQRWLISKTVRNCSTLLQTISVMKLDESTADSCQQKPN